MPDTTWRAQFPVRLRVLWKKGLAAYFFGQVNCRLANDGAEYLYRVPFFQERIRPPQVPGAARSIPKLISWS
jgi:hypothetical protein